MRGARGNIRTADPSTGRPGEEAPAPVRQMAQRALPLQQSGWSKRSPGLPCRDPGGGKGFKPDEI